MEKWKWWNNLDLNDKIHARKSKARSKTHDPRWRLDLVRVIRNGSFASVKGGLIRGERVIHTRIDETRSLLSQCETKFRVLTNTYMYTNEIVWIENDSTIVSSKCNYLLN